MCMIDGCDEPYLIYNPPAPTKAAKEHTCTECSRKIAKGETYYRSSGLYDNQWDTHHTCSHCRIACEWLDVNCGGFLHHAVEEDISEHAFEYNRADLRRLHVAMRRKWQRKRGSGLRWVPKLPRPLAEGDARPGQ